MQNQFQRTESILGADSTARLKKCRVAVFGVGGVGGYVVESLARSGIGTIDIIDSDTIDITNLNRQIIATHDSIGRYKVDVFEERIHSICPDTTVNKKKGLYLPSGSAARIIEQDNADGPSSASFDSPAAATRDNTQETKIAPVILTEKDFDFAAYDYIVDAIDNVTAKLSIICEANLAGTPVISSMGSGNRIDPSLLKVTDIFKTHDDPLAKIMRKKLRAAGIKQLKVVCSDEPPMKPSARATASERDNDRAPKKNAPGSTPFVPGSAGLIIASVVVRDLLSSVTAAPQPSL